jgi:metallo-beta-lactamase class B
MRPHKLLPCLLFVLLAASQMPAQTKQAPLKQAGKTDWNAPFPAHKVIGNVYFVGSAELASFLITTPQGHILINSDFEATVPVIRASVEKLGFKFTDIKILLGSHAHGDHMEGDAMVKELSGARVMAMEQDVPWLRKMTPGGKPHPIDHILKDGEEVKLGGATLTAHLTAGHTPGCTTWTTKVDDNGKVYNVLIVCSVGVNPGTVLVNNKDYPSIAGDYARSFKVLRTMPVDVFLGAHGSFYGLQAKYAKLQGGGANPFIDLAGFKAYLDDKESAFTKELGAQKAQWK